MKKSIVALVISIYPLCYAQHYSVDSLKKYSFIIRYPPSRLFSMRQFNQCYIDTYRMFLSLPDENFKRKNFAEAIQVLTIGLFLMPLTHEEGRRSVHTAKNLNRIRLTLH